jgi:hypothetical protein
MSQGEATLVFIKFLRVSWDFYVKRTQKQRIPKKFARAAIEVRKRREKVTEKTER